MAIQQQKIMTGDEVRAVLNDALQKANTGGAPEGYFVDVVCQLLVNQATTDQKLVDTCRVLNQRIKQLEGGGAPASSGQTAVAGTISQPAVPPGGTRIGMDGNPMSPEEEARERAMDAAIAAGEAEKAAGGGQG